MAFACTGTIVLNGSQDDPICVGELVPPDLRFLIEILKAKSKTVQKILKVFRPEPNLVHQKIMMGRGDYCWSIIPFMVVGRTNGLVNFNVQRLGRLRTCRVDDPLLGSLLVVAPLTTLWSFSFTR
ncbi:hypothetical protein AMTR_s00134p00072180 [Amborella trichopoda]|uniref:Uncharacterized protein n=1 Tax=Amborella trichopoda TaxID=13333 RepID=W1P5T1_AMBTC|nr:hypothetical protein AMTR_s00134p00072180 [Amborella trichopoda]